MIFTSSGIGLRPEKGNPPLLGIGTDFEEIKPE